MSTHYSEKWKGVWKWLTLRITLTCNCDLNPPGLWHDSLIWMACLVSWISSSQWTMRPQSLKSTPHWLAASKLWWTTLRAELMSWVTVRALISSHRVLSLKTSKPRYIGTTQYDTLSVSNEASHGACLWEGDRAIELWVFLGCWFENRPCSAWMKYWTSMAG